MPQTSLRAVKKTLLPVSFAGNPSTEMAQQWKPLFARSSLDFHCLAIHAELLSCMQAKSLERLIHLFLLL